MKPFCPTHSATASGRVQPLRAFTLPEMMLAMSVCMLVMIGLITTHIFGWRMFEFLKPKASANEAARLAVSMLTGEVRSANLVRVGQGGLTSFAEVPPGALQQGNALQVYPTGDTNSFVRYYWDQADQKLKRMTNGSACAQAIANCVTNQLVFTSEDFAGNILADNQNNHVVGLTLQFCQIENSMVKIGPGEFYDSYQIRLKVTRRAVL
jgi:hypothetical protein